MFRELSQPEKPQPDFSLLDLFKELFVTDVEIGAMSVEELAEKKNCSAGTIRRKLKLFIEQGLVEFAGFRKTRAIDGRITNVPIYRGKNETR